jgi:uncharacterized protein YcfL
MKKRIRAVTFVLVCCACSAETQLALAARSTMATSQLMKGFGNSCPNVSIVSDDKSADYVIEAQGPQQTEVLKHYRITVFDKTGKAIFSTDKHSLGAATKEVCKFLLNNTK